MLIEKEKRRYIAEVKAYDEEMKKMKEALATDLKNGLGNEIKEKLNEGSKPTSKENFFKKIFKKQK